MYVILAEFIGIFASIQKICNTNEKGYIWLDNWLWFCEVLPLSWEIKCVFKENDSCKKKQKKNHFKMWLLWDI